MPTYLPPELAPLIEAEWRSHIADGFRWLSAIPSGYLAACCEIFRENPSKYSVPFLRRYSAGELSAEERTELWSEYLKVVKKNPYRYKAVAEWKPRFKHQLENEELPSEERESLEALWLELAAVDTPKATDIRKALKPILEREFNTKIISRGGGVWVAPISLSGVPLTLVFDFGGFSKGLRHELWLPLKLEQGHRAKLSYESALGFNMPPWNLLRTNVLPDQLEMLVQVIKKTLAWLAFVDLRSETLDVPKQI